jgi:hypothetical protein
VEPPRRLRRRVDGKRYFALPHHSSCANASTTQALRRVPHLTVTWAHQPHSQGYDPHPYNGQWQPNSLNLYPQGRRMIGRIQFNSYPTLVHRSPNSSIGSSAMSPMHKDVTSDARDAHEPSSSSEQFVPLQHEVTGDAAKLVDVSDAHSTISPKSECKTSPTQGEVENITKVQWSEMDFPSLAEVKRDRIVEGGAKETEEFVLFFSRVRCFTNPPVLLGGLFWQLLLLP